MRGRDGEIHAITFHASSLFDAADQGITAWAKFWYFDPKAIIQVEADGKRYAVKQDRVRQWRGRTQPFGVMVPRMDF
jgi:hypothetical protein